MPQPPPTRPGIVWITRPAPAARETALRVRALGHRVLVAPVLRVVPVSEPSPPGPFAGIVVTSARAIESLDAAGRARLMALGAQVPVFAVGARTAAAAHKLGLGAVTEGEGDAAALAALIAGATARRGRLLHLAGRPRKAEPEASLVAAGFILDAWTTYATEIVERLPASASDALAAGGIRSVLHYSRRSAEAALALAAAAGRGADFRGSRHHCLSADVAAPLVGAGVACHVVAARPSEAALLATLAPPGPPGVS